MKMKPLSQACALAAAALFAATPAQAQFSGDVIKIGFATDMSGLYSDIDGPGGVEAIKMAIADAGGVMTHRQILFVIFLILFLVSLLRGALTR